jgi:hypothetical protein
VGGERRNHEGTVKKDGGHSHDFSLFLLLIENLGQAGFELLVAGPVAPEKLTISPERATEKIKGFAHFLGTDLVRIGPLDPALVTAMWAKPGTIPADDTVPRSH